MAPRARGARARGRAGRAQGGSSNRTPARGKRKNDGIPDVYRELMHEAGEPSRPTDDVEEESRPRKRPRRAPFQPHSPIERPQPVVHVESSPPPPPLPTQTTINESESELEFEDVELGGSAAEEGVTDEDAPKIEEEDFSVTIKPGEVRPPARSKRKRRPVTSAERSVRLAIHKMHVCYLLYHVFYRNHWCNDEVAQAILKPMASARIVQLLNPDSRASQAQSSSFFLLGLNQLCDLFYARFRITSLGMQRPKWFAEKEDLKTFELPEKSEKPLELADFRRAANSMQGSADLGAQLFCCLLRAVGVEARLVCSLQPLGFASAAEVAPASASNTPAKKTLYLQDDEEKAHTTANGDSSASAPRRIARVGQPRAAAHEAISQRDPSLSEKSSRIERPSYPVFWVEAFNTAHQKWVAVDAIATHTVGKPSRLEPSINDPRNCMTYVIAFEEDGLARDVTHRYTKAFTAKTRKLRVENTDNGTTWLRKALKLFRRPRQLDRDALEDAELTAKAAQEGMPKNVQDFKNHPLYALERHLRRNEIIHPKQESGRINAGTANNPKFESVYRRNNVHVVKSADKWFRLGRELKEGEQPMKFATPRRGTRVRESPLDPEVVDEVGIGLYAAFQTQVYVPPAVGSDGKIPKNQYGNIDVYVPSMIPDGAVWVRMPEAKLAAKLLKVDYADAVTGFDFKGRHGTARIDGVVVAEQHFEAMEIACDALREGREDDLMAERRREALRLWRKFLVGLREVDRIEGYLRNAEEAETSKMAEEENTKESDSDHGSGEGGFMRSDHGSERGGGGGGFMADGAGSSPPPSAQRTRPKRNRKSLAHEMGGFFAESDDEGGGGGFVAESSDSAGGFVPEAMSEDENDHNGGGFVPHEDDRNATEDNEVPEQDETNETTADDTPFGFANIRIPQLSRSILDADQDRDLGLPRFVRGMRRPQKSLLAADAEDFDMTEVVAPMKDDDNGGSAEQVVTVLQPATPSGTQKAELETDRNPAEAMSSSAGESGSPHSVQASVENAVVGDKMESNLSAKEEPPLSSYEYDDDMLDEDPEDEDAEPEWLA